MVLKSYVRLTSGVIRMIWPYLLSIYVTLVDFVQSQRKSITSSLPPSNRRKAAVIAGLSVICFFWGLHALFVLYNGEVHHAKFTNVQPMTSSRSAWLHSSRRPLLIGDYTNTPTVEPDDYSQLDSIGLDDPPPHMAAAHDVGRPDRPLILYAYAESANARSNLQFFLKKGLHGRADFVFILNGEAPEAAKLIPRKLPNVRVVQRSNTCYDIGAFGEVLRSQIRVGGGGGEERGVQLWERYKKFITINASIRGPFLPTWSNECWSDAFLRKLTYETKVSWALLVLSSWRIVHGVPPSRPTLTLYAVSLSDYHTNVSRHHTCSLCCSPRITSACPS